MSKLSDTGRETLKQIFDRVNKMTPEQRERVLQLTEAVVFLSDAKKN